MTRGAHRGFPMRTRLAAALGAAVVWTIWLSFVQWTGLTSGLIDRGMVELLAHETPPFLSWSGGVHPPLYSVVLWLAEHGADPTGIAPERLLFLHGVVANVLLVAVIGGVAWRWLGPAPGVAAAWLMAFGTEGLRSFEHYPVSALATTTAALAALALARHGGRQRVGIAAVLGFLALWLHLSPWFLLGPLLVLLWLGAGPRRRDVFVAAAVVLVVWMATTWPGLYRQLAEGGPGGSEAGAATVGWLNPFLFLPLGLWLIPRIGRSAPDVRLHGALVGALLVYTLVTFGLQLAQIADGQPYPSSLHYFALVEPLMVLAAVAAVTSGWRSASGHAQRVVVVLIGLTLAGTQLWRWADGMTWIWRSQQGVWLQALQPWNWL